jgi:hypothetical protein
VVKDLTNPLRSEIQGPGDLFLGRFSLQDLLQPVRDLAYPVDGLADMDG